MIEKLTMNEILIRFLKSTAMIKNKINSSLLIFYFPFILLFISCAPNPVPIEYGEDMCDFCMMTIVDAQFGSELVSSKGKAFKFDAIECMLQYMIEEGDSKFALALVNQFDNKGALSDGEKSHYLVSENLPSPMGANLSAHSTYQNALKMQKSKGGKIYSWDEILERYKSFQENINNQ